MHGLCEMDGDEARTRTRTGAISRKICQSVFPPPTTRSAKTNERRVIGRPTSHFFGKTPPIGEKNGRFTQELWDVLIGRRPSEKKRSPHSVQFFLRPLERLVRLRNVHALLLLLLLLAMIDDVLTLRTRCRT